jgi:hypothetical protein
MDGWPLGWSWLDCLFFGGSGMTKVREMEQLSLEDAYIGIRCFFFERNRTTTAGNRYNCLWKTGCHLGNASLVLLQQEWDSRGRRMARLYMQDR